MVNRYNEGVVHMRIGVISDTHLSPRVQKLPDALIAGLW